MCMLLMLGEGCMVIQWRRKKAGDRGVRPSPIIEEGGPEYVWAKDLPRPYSIIHITTKPYLSHISGGRGGSNTTFLQNAYMRVCMRLHAKDNA